MYWLDVCGLERGPSSCITTYKCKLIALDIKNLNDIKLIFDKTISDDDFPKFAYKCYTMLIVGNTIQFILGGNTCTYDEKHGRDCDDAKWMHYEFDIKTHKLSLIHKNLHIKAGAKNGVTRSKVFDFVENLEIGDWVDIKDSRSTFYLAKILGIEDKKYFAICDDNDNDVDDEMGDISGKLRSMSIKVHYDGWSNQFDE